MQKGAMANIADIAMNYDIPIDRERQKWNMFFYDGPARTWICHAPPG
jgi:hypothetical protein